MFSISQLPTPAAHFISLHSSPHVPVTAPCKPLSPQLEAFSLESFSSNNIFTSYIILLKATIFKHFSKCSHSLVFKYSPTVGLLGLVVFIYFNISFRFLKYPLYPILNFRPFEVFLPRTSASHFNAVTLMSYRVSPIIKLLFTNLNIYNYCKYFITRIIQKVSNIASSSFVELSKVSEAMILICHKHSMLFKIITYCQTRQLVMDDKM